MKRFDYHSFPGRVGRPGIRVLRPMFVAGMIMPVAQGDGGINIYLVESGATGVLTVIDPYLDMQAGDRISVFIGDDTTPVHVFDVAQADERQAFFLSPELFKPDWLENVRFQVLRVGATQPEDSVPIRLRVKLQRPAGRDKEPHLPWHSELALPGLAQDVIDNGVTADWAAKGVPVLIGHYPDRAAFDTLELRWGDVRILREITEDEAAGQDPVEVLVTQADILAAGDSPRLQVHYQVYDLVWNFSEKWSQPAFVLVEAGAWRLDAPVIKEAIGGEIDLLALGSDDVTLQIEVRAPVFAFDDYLDITWLGTTQAGDTLQHRQTIQIKNLPSIIEANVPNFDIRRLASGKGEASYVLRKLNGEPPQSSRRAIAKIIGELSDVPAPIILEAIGDLLDSRLDHVWVLLGAYSRMAAGDVLELVWQGTRADGSEYLQQWEEVVSGTEVGFPIPLLVEGVHVAALDRGTLALYYRVKGADSRLRESDRAYFKVAALVHDLPAPQVLEADDDVLDPEVTFPDGATVRTTYLETRAGDVLTCYWVSVYSDGTSSDWVPVTEVSQGHPVDFRISNRLIEISRGTNIWTLYTLKRGDQTRVSLPVELYIGKPIPVTIFSIVDSWGEVAEGGTSVDESVVISGTASASMSVELYDGTHLLGMAVANLEGVWRYPMLELEAKAYAIKAKALYGSGRESEVRTFNRVANVVPSITRVDDSRGEVINDGATVDTTVTLSGKASAGLQVELFSDGQSWGQVGVEATGDWRSTRNGLAIATYEVTAVALYADLLPSEPRGFRVVAEVAPTLVSVVDSRGELEEGRTTVDTRITVSGKASIDQPLELLDGGLPLAPIQSNAQGEWSHVLNDLSVKRYVINARALYGSGQQSTSRSFSVVDYIFPTITSVRDSRGEVSDGGATVDTTITLSGEGSANEKVEIFNGATSVGTPQVNAAGVWTLQLIGLTPSVYGIRAKALYGAGEESAVRTFTIYVEIKPSVTSVRDTRGEVAQGGTTVDASVTLVGKGSINQRLELFDGLTSLGPVQIDVAGNWSHVMTGLAMRAYSIKAKALYGAGLESDVRTFTVVAEEAPAISNVRDSLGNVADNGFTYDSSVTVTGVASRGQRIELFDGASSKGQAPADATGNWTLSATGLALGQHTLKAVALYGSGRESGLRRFEVRQGVTPVITRVVDSKGNPISNGGRTYETGLTLSGTAQAGLQVQLLDNGVPRGGVTSAPGGSWQSVQSSLAVGSHVFTAQGVYGNRPVSGAWRVTVENRPPLQIDTSTMTLNGRLFNGGNLAGPANRPAGTSSRRSATGGVPPYTYASSNAAVASVNASDGTVMSAGNGSATITVRDSAQQSASYSVIVSNVVSMNYIGQWQFASIFQVAPNEETLRAIYNQYPGGGLSRLGFPRGNFWTSNSEHHPWPFAKGVYLNMDNGGKGWEAQLGRSFYTIRLG